MTILVGVAADPIALPSYSMSGDDGAVQFTHTIVVGSETRWGILDVPCGDELGAGTTNSHHRSFLDGDMTPIIREGS